MLFSHLKTSDLGKKGKSLFSMDRLFYCACIVTNAVESDSTPAQAEGIPDDT